MVFIPRRLLYKHKECTTDVHASMDSQTEATGAVEEGEEREDFELMLSKHLTSLSLSHNVLTLWAVLLTFGVASPFLAFVLACFGMFYALSFMIMVGRYYSLCSTNMKQRYRDTILDLLKTTWRGTRMSFYVIVLFS